MVSKMTNLTTMEGIIIIKDIRTTIIRVIIIIKVGITIIMDTKILIKVEEGIIKVNIQEIPAEAKINTEIRNNIIKKRNIPIKMKVKLTKLMNKDKEVDNMVSIIEEIQIIEEVTEVGIMDIMDMEEETGTKDMIILSTSLITMPNKEKELECLKDLMNIAG
jgi:hypothetical protein